VLESLLVDVSVLDDGVSSLELVASDEDGCVELDVSELAATVVASEVSSELPSLVVVP
jgi:hypothetical protein